LAAALPCPFCNADVESADNAPPQHCTACGRDLVVCKKFRLRGVLGRGGMGVVYDGVRETDKKAVAVKLMALKDDWTSWELFERSTEVLRGLKHSRLPHVFAFDRTESGRLILVREAFDGGTLEERIRKRDDRLEPKRVRQLLIDLLELLEYLQHLVPPVIHRDIKPANIMFRSKDDWDPVLVDFDTVAAPQSQRSGLTVVGTPGYAAPEQFAAESTPASDIYGLGATMLFVATHTDADSLPRKKGKFDVEKDLRNIDADVRHALLKMVEPESAKRYARARDVLKDLEKGVTSDEPKPEPKPEKPKSAARQPLRHPDPFAGRSIVMLIFLGIRWFFVALFKLVWGIVLLIMGVAMIVGVVASMCEKKKSSSYEYSPSRTSWRSEATTYENECDKGKGDSCFEAGWRYGSHKDYDNAVPLYQKGCKLGHAMACNNLAVQYEYGRGGLKEDRHKAAELYDYACGLDNGLACANLGWMYDVKGSLGQDDAKCMHFRLRACDLKQGQGCNSAGYMYEAGRGVKKDYAKAAEYYTRACDLSYMHGCRNLGMAFLEGWGVAKSERRALALFKQACEKDNADACFRAGKMFDDGMGTDRDLERATALYQQACKGDSPEGCNAYGYANEKGRGIAANQPLAVGYYVKACDLGNAWGCNNWATALLSGDGTTQDIPRAISLLEKSCTNKETQGCYNLGVLYRDGGEVAKDLAKSAAYFTQACNLGDSESCKSKGSLTKHR
jgi:TPR repeat protein